MIIPVTDFISGCPFTHSVYACCKRAGRIDYFFTLTGLTNGWNTVGTIPAAYAPLFAMQEEPILAQSGSYGGFIRLSNNSNGTCTVTLLNATTESTVSGKISYITNN